MSANDAREYVLGTHDAELVRLGLQHQLWRAYTSALWERAGFQPGQTLVDVGCGPGYATFDLAQLVGDAGRVVAVDESQRFLDYLQGQCQARGVPNVETHQCDVQQLDLPAARADGAYARWVLCFVPRPEAVIAGVAKALRPGGVFAIQDYFGYASLTLAPRSPIMTRVVEAVSESWIRHGGDLDVAGKLPGFLLQHGFTVREIRPVVRVARPGSPLWQWPTTFFTTFVPRLVEMGLLTPADQRAFETEWVARSQDPATFFVTPPVFEILAVRN